MMREHETTIELAGEPLAAVVQYERCPFDGHPVIYEVIFKGSKLEIARALKEWQLVNLEAEIEAAIADNAIDSFVDGRWFRRVA